MEIKKRWKCLLVMLASILLFVGAAEAYFTDFGRVAAAAGTAHILLEAAGSSCGEKPEYLDEDTVFTFSCKVRNTGTAAAYVKEKVTVLINGKEMDDSMVTLTGGTTSDQATASGAYKTLTWQLRVHGAEQLSGEKAELRVYVDLQAFTEKDGKGGFSSASIRMTPLDYTGKDALPLPIKEKKIRLSGIYTAGNQVQKEVWYWTDETRIGIGDRMTWKELNVSEWLTIKAGVPLICRYELVADVGTVRSPIYQISLEDGAIQKTRYNYFTGALLSD